MVVRASAVLDGFAGFDGKRDGANDEKKWSKVLRNRKRKAEKSKLLAVAEVTETDNVYSGENREDEKKSKLKKKKRSKERTKDAVNEVGVYPNLESDKLDGANVDNKRNEVVRNKKRKNAKLCDAETTEIINSAGMNDKKKRKLKKKKRNKENTKEHSAHKYDGHPNKDDSNQQDGESKSVSQTENDASLLDDKDVVYQISSGDEDETTGMKRWITDYHRARPGVKILWEGINDYFVDYWAQKEKERKEREAEAAEGGWTVVAHHKGRKKTTDSESGITVGSVAQEAVMDKMAKKKNKQVGLNFYRFQRREAQMNEIMMLQSKFEQDKKRIQQMRAARKFRPY